MVDTVSGQKQINIDLYNQDFKIDAKGLPQTGTGINGIGKNVPDAPSTATPTSLETLMGSLGAFMSGGSSVDTEVLLLQVTVAMRDTEASSQKAKINTDQEAKKAELKEKDAKLEEAAKKMEEAERKRTSGNLLDKIKLAFEWLGAILATVVAAIAIATGVGAVAGALLMAAAVTAIVMAVDSTVQQATGLGIAGNLVMATAELRGLSPEEAEKEAAKADMGFKIALAVAGIVLSIAGGVASSASSLQAGVNAAKTAGETAEKSAGFAAKIKDMASAFKTAFKEAAEASVQTVSETMKTVRTTVNAMETAQVIANTGVEAASIGIKFEATEARADAKGLQADAKRSEAVLQMLDDMIDQALTRLMSSGDRFAAMLDAITDGMQDRSSTLSRASFSA